MTKALILAAGQGSRLQPLTQSRPKCLVELVGKTLLSRQASVLRSHGITDIHVVTGYLKEEITKLGFSTSFNSKYESTNMVESLFCATTFLESCCEDLIISYGDIVYNSSNLQAMLSSDASLSLMIDKNWRDLWSIRFENPLSDAETLKVDDNGFVIELGKKPMGYADVQGQYTGLIKIRKDKIAKLIELYRSLGTSQTYDGQGFENMYMTSFLQCAIDQGWMLKAVNVSGGWLEVDTVSDIEIYEDLAARSALTQFYDL